jgi:pilus assembly protein CpaE
MFKQLEQQNPSTSVNKNLGIGVLGVKGGVGATTLAINLATALAELAQRENARSCLLDLNLQQPDIACLLNVKPKYSLSELILRAEHLNADILDACLATKPITNNSQTLNLNLLSPPLKIDDALAIKGNQLESLTAHLLNLHCGQYWTIDLPKTIDHNLVSMLDNLEKLVLVLEPTMACLAALNRWLGVLKELEFPQDKLYLVLNRANGKIKEIETQLKDSIKGLPIIKVANAYEMAEAATIDGVALIEKYSRSQYAKDLQNLTDSLKLSLARVE